MTKAARRTIGYPSLIAGFLPFEGPQSAPWILGLGSLGNRQIYRPHCGHNLNVGRSPLLANRCSAPSPPGMQLSGVLCLVYEPSNCFQTRPQHAHARTYTFAGNLLSPAFFPRRLRTIQWSEAGKQANGIGGICNMTCIPIHCCSCRAYAFRWRLSLVAFSGLNVGWILCYSQLVAIYFTKLHTEQLYSGENKLKCCHSSLVFAAIIHHGKCRFSPSLAPLSSTLVVLWLISTFTLWLVKVSQRVRKWKSTPTSHT